MAAACGIAEAYVLRKLHAEKMRKEKEGAKSSGIDDAQLPLGKPRNSGRFFGKFKKIRRPSSAVHCEDVQKNSADSSPIL